MDYIKNICLKCNKSAEVFEYRINFEEFIRICSNPLCEQSFEIGKEDIKHIKQNDDLIKQKYLQAATFEDILNNFNQFSTEADNLKRILIPQESQYNEPIKQESNYFNNNQQMASSSNDDQKYNNNTQFSSILDDFFDLESILPDQLLPDYNNVKQELPAMSSTAITETSLDSNSFISSITETNKLLYNTDSNNHQFSNSCIEITKIKDNKYKHIDMPIFDELIFLNDSKDSKTTVVVDDYNSNKKSSNINDENDQELLPWERQKRTRTKLSDVKVFPNNTKTLKPSGITKQNLSSKVNNQKSELNSKEKAALLKNALLEDSNKLSSSFKIASNGQQPVSSYRELVLNVLKKKNT